MMIGDLLALKVLVVERRNAPLGPAPMIWSQLIRLKTLVSLNIQSEEEHEIYMEAFKSMHSKSSSSSSYVESSPMKTLRGAHLREESGKRGRLVMYMAQYQAENVLDFRSLFPHLERRVFDRFDVTQLLPTQNLIFPAMLTELMAVKVSAAKFGTALSSLRRLDYLWTPIVNNILSQPHMMQCYAMTSANSEEQPVHTFLPNLASYTVHFSASPSDLWITSFPQTLTALDVVFDST